MYNLSQKTWKNTCYFALMHCLFIYIYIRYQEKSQTYLAASSDTPTGIKAMNKVWTCELHNGGRNFVSSAFTFIHVLIDKQDLLYSRAVQQ